MSTLTMQPPRGCRGGPGQPPRSSSWASRWPCPVSPPARPRPPKGPPGEAKAPSSYDQVTPVLLGQESFEEMMAKDKADKAAVMARQKKLLEERYDLTAAAAIPRSR